MCVRMGIHAEKNVDEMYMHAQLYAYLHAYAHPSLSSFACYTFFFALLPGTEHPPSLKAIVLIGAPPLPPPARPRLRPPCLHHLAQTLHGLHYTACEP